MSPDCFNSTFPDLEEDMLPEDDDLLFGDEELAEKIEHDVQWGRYLYNHHTQNGAIPITPDLAATLSYRDLECIIVYPSLEAQNLFSDDVVSATIDVCTREIMRRDEQIEEVMYSKSKR